MHAYTIASSREDMVYTLASSMLVCRKYDTMHVYALAMHVHISEIYIRC